jgi:GH24 family phage-related lysozyme (muramidase)
MSAKGQVAAQTALTPNEGLSMSPEARAKMRRRERDVYEYYDDMGPGKGNCTWGAGILAHLKPCTKDEIGKRVSRAAIDAEYARRVAIVERGVRHNVRKTALNQEQFDALVSLAYNAGVSGSMHVFRLIDKGELNQAAGSISRMTSTTVNGKKVLARGLIARRAEESAPFRSIETKAVAKK